ncbi:MAG: cob(I)yrinic acid a,c-diamide adenosyltransferase [Clostridia bacterium]|nr:cob(I)yrinic acid a,c-diamide adenosyltransferase [Clostridia bacterium]
MAGLVHIYCGDGKGKTTAAAGLAIRAAGAGMRVVFAQFQKDGTSSEIKALGRFDNIDVEFVGTNYGFYRNMSPKEKEAAAEDYTKLLLSVMKKAAAGADMLVLDEVISACNNRLVPEEMLCGFIKVKPPGLEVVLTGRNPSRKLLSLSDYITEMRKIKHPFDCGIPARRGVEF